MEKKTSNVIKFPDRPKNSVVIDEELEFWGDVYVAARVGDRTSANFEEFMKSPHRHLTACGQEDAVSMLNIGFLPLLPKQEAVIHSLHERWDSQERTCRQAVNMKDGVFVGDLVPSR